MKKVMIRNSRIPAAMSVAKEIRKLPYPDVKRVKLDIRLAAAYEPDAKDKNKKKNPNEKLDNKDSKKTGQLQIGPTAEPKIAVLSWAVDPRFEWSRRQNFEAISGTRRGSKRIRAASAAADRPKKPRILPEPQPEPGPSMIA